MTPSEGRVVGRRAKLNQAHAAIARADRFITTSPGSSAADTVRHLRDRLADLIMEIEILTATGESK